MSLEIREALASDEEAFIVLVKRYKPVLFRWAVALVGDQDEAEDVTQEAFVRAYRKIGTFRGDGSVEAWLYRIMQRVVSRHRTKRARRTELDALPGDHSSLDVYVTDPGGRVDRENMMALIREMVATLPMRQREVFVLCDLQGYAPSEVGDMLGMKDVSVRASLFKARAAIRREALLTHPAFQEYAT